MARILLLLGTRFQIEFTSCDYIPQCFYFEQKIDVIAAEQNDNDSEEVYKVLPTLRRMYL